MTNELESSLERLCRNFPSVPHDVVASVLGDSYRVVVEASGEPLVDKAESLTRLRLEVRTRRPALQPA